MFLKKWALRMDVFEKNDIGIFKKVVKLSRHDALMKIENETLNKLGDIISFFFYALYYRNHGFLH